MEIYRRDGDAFSSIRAAFDTNGNLKIDGQDMGPKLSNSLEIVILNIT